jgi:hypothetical protein
MRSAHPNQAQGERRKRASHRRVSDEWAQVFRAESVLEAIHERGLLGLELRIRQDAGLMQFS